MAPIVTTGEAAVTIDRNLEAAREALQRLPDFGSDIEGVAADLEDDGVQKLVASHDALVAGIRNMGDVTAHYAAER